MGFLPKTRNSIRRSRTGPASTFTRCAFRASLTQPARRRSPSVDSCSRIEQKCHSAPLPRGFFFASPPSLSGFPVSREARESKFRTRQWRWMSARGPPRVRRAQRRAHHGRPARVRRTRIEGVSQRPLPRSPHPLQYPSSVPRSGSRFRLRRARSDRARPPSSAIV
jgi:hypothetical protein